MKKVLWKMCLLALAALLCLPAAAEGMEVQIIAGPETGVKTATLDDIQIGAAIEVDDNCIFTPTSYMVADSLNTYKEGSTNATNSGYGRHGWTSYISGNEAEFALLRMDILNLQLAPVNFLEQAEVKVVYDDTYEFAGWCYQYNYDNTYDDTIYDSEEIQDANTQFVIHHDDEFAISPMYTGHYVFGCTLPNSVIESDLPMRMEIKVAGNELTYNIR